MDSGLTSLQASGYFSFGILLVGLLIFLGLPKKPKYTYTATKEFKEYEILFVRRNNSCANFYVEYLDENNMVFSTTCPLAIIGDENKLVVSVYTIREEETKEEDTKKTGILLYLTKEDYNKIIDNAELKCNISGYVFTNRR